MGDSIYVMAIVFGGLIAFTGYRMFTDLLRVWGLVVVGIVGAYISTFIVKPPAGAFQITVPLAIGFGAGGLIGFLFAEYVRGVIAFLTGAMLGILAGTQGMVLIGFRSDTLLAAGLGLVLGVMSLRFEEIVLIISTSFVGAAAFGYGILNLVKISPILLAIGFFLVGFLGAAAQYNDAKRGHD